MSLPEGIGRLASLKELYLSGNSLKTLPKSILKMKRLTYVDFQDNQFCKTSAEFSAWLKKWDKKWKSTQKCW